MAYNCEEEVEKLWNAYNELVANPNRPVRVRKGEREVEFHGGHLKALESLYMISWRKCGKKLGYPPIGDSYNTRRGPAARVTF